MEFENLQSHSPLGYKDGLDDELEDQPKPENHPLDGPKTMARLQKILRWWHQTLMMQAGCRTARIKDHEIKDGDQWDEADAAEVEDRGQIPLVFNKVKPALDWITGTEKRTRIDYRVLPRSSEDAKGAEAKTKLIKYTGDVNKEAFHRSRAFDDASISGLGWLEAGIRSDIEDEPLFVRYEDWRNMWYDPYSVERDLTDARFVFRAKYLDLDIAQAMFPDRIHEIRACALQNETYFEDTEFGAVEDESLQGLPEYSGEFEWDWINQRSRVRIMECWYREPVSMKVMRGKALGTLSGTPYDPANEAMAELVKYGIASLHDALTMRVRVLMFVGNHALQDKPSPYRHNRFPFIPIWAFRRKKTNAPYGVVRNLRDPQDDLNKRRSKALFLLSTNQVIADDNATDDWDELADEKDRPDGIIRKKPGTHLEINRDTQLAEEHVMLMDQDAKYIETTSGVTDELRGETTNAISGKAILARQEQGHVVTAELFDNLRYSVQLLGEIKLSLIEQFYNDEKEIRILGDRNQADFLAINQVDPRTGEVMNDITAGQADFVVDTANYNATVRQAMFEAMMNLLGQMDPQVALSLLDLVVDLSDLPGKEEMVKRIREINGQSDPDADPNDPENQAEENAKQQAEAKRQMLQELLQELELEEKAANIDKTKAEAEAKKASVMFEGEKTNITKAEVLNRIEEREDRARQAKETALEIKGQGKRPKEEDRLKNQKDKPYVEE